MIMMVMMIDVIIVISECLKNIQNILRYTSDLITTLGRRDFHSLHFTDKDSSREANCMSKSHNWW